MATRRPVPAVAAPAPAVPASPTSPGPLDDVVVRDIAPPPFPVDLPEPTPSPVDRRLAHRHRHAGTMQVIRLFAPGLRSVLDEEHISDDMLDPQQLQLRGLYRHLLDDLEQRGETIGIAHVHLVSEYLTSALLLAQINVTLMQMAKDHAISNKKSRSMFPIFRQRDEAIGNMARLAFRLGLVGSARQRAKARGSDLARSLAAGWFKDQEARAR